MSSSERSYFAFRYVLPGYTFLTSILIINIEFLIRVINHFSTASASIVALFGILFGFISLLSGSAIGFLISQFWYLIYNYHWKSHKKLTTRRSQIKLTNIEGIKKHIKEDTEVEDRVSIMAYILTSITNERITNYINRLNDVINSLASTIFAILFGGGVGYSLRFWVFHQTWVRYDCIIGFLLVVFMFLLGCNLRRVLREHDSISRLVIVLYEREIKKEFEQAQDNLTKS